MKSRIKTPGVGIAGAAALLVATLAGCASSTTMMHSWTTPDFKPGTVKKVFVLGVARDQGLRRLYEDTFVATLTKRGVGAAAGYTLLPDPSQVDKEKAGAAIRQEGYSHVLVTRVVNVEQRETYVPPSTVSVGVGYGGYPGYYGGWYPYMSTSYGYVTSPGYVTVNKVVSLETNVYDVQSEKLIYSGMTETWVDNSPDQQIGKVVDTLVWDLRAKSVF
jgi:hypothetical protein